MLYNARDMAVLRASICGAQVVLASATPSLESWTNAEAGKIPQAGTDLALWRGGDARHPSHRHAGGNACRRTAGSHPACSRPCRRGSRRVNRHSCSSIAGGTPPSRSAGPAVIKWAATIAMRGWWNTGFSNVWSVINAEKRSPIPQACPSCSVEDKLAAVGPGVERLTDEAGCAFPRRADRNFVF